jgi:hypothetical protein
MKKCQKNNEDPYIGLLNLRNSPTEGIDTSPVQRLMQRRTHALIPTSTDALEPSVSPDETQWQPKGSRRLSSTYTGKRSHLSRRARMLEYNQSDAERERRTMALFRYIWMGKATRLSPKMVALYVVPENISARFKSITP